MKRKIVIACDSFKGSLTAPEVCEAVQSGVTEALPQPFVTVRLPLADGGEGTAATLAAALGGKRVDTDATDPLGRPIKASYYILPGGKAVVELASASGLTLLDPDERNPLLTSTFGTGQLVRDAMTKGCREILLCIGGSATNDCATGLLSALGYRFLDSSGNAVEPCGGNLGAVTSIDTTQIMPELASVSFAVACDVTNPLYGESGAAAVYGPQKGATTQMVTSLDEGMRRFAAVMERHAGKDPQLIAGGGAAGGVGAGLALLLHARLKPGAEMVLDETGFDSALAHATLVITGEGRIDSQTLQGKLPYAVMRRALAANVPAWAVAGSVRDEKLLLQSGFSGVLAVSDPEVPLAESMQRDVAMANIRRVTGRWLKDCLNRGLI